MATVKQKAHKIIHGKSFVPRFDDGGDVDYDSGDSYGGVNFDANAPLTYNTPSSYAPVGEGTVSAPNSGTPSASEIAALTSGATNPNSIASEIAANPASLSPDGIDQNTPIPIANGSSSSSSANTAGGALGSLLKALGLGGGSSGSSASGLAALT